MNANMLKYLFKKGNDYMKNFKINTIRGIITFMLVSMPATITGCAKTVECDVNGTHAHLYTNDDGYVRYLEDEHEKVKGFDRTDTYIELTKEEENFYKFLQKFDLMSISDNLETLIEEQLANQDYQEYRYSYPIMTPIPHIVSNGKTTYTYFTYVPGTAHTWTDDPNHGNLTGTERTVHFVYQAYKITVDAKGNYQLEASEYVDDLRDIMEEYPYIKLEHAKKVNLYNDEELDYEDGPEEELEEEVIDESKNSSYKGLA